jgi:hypothetical protein
MSFEIAFPFVFTKVKTPDYYNRIINGSNPDYIQFISGLLSDYYRIITGFTPYNPHNKFLSCLILS